MEGADAFELGHNGALSLTCRQRVVAHRVVVADTVLCGGENVRLPIDVDAQPCCRSHRTRCGRQSILPALMLPHLRRVAQDDPRCLWTDLDAFAGAACCFVKVIESHVGTPESDLRQHSSLLYKRKAELHKCEVLIPSPTMAGAWARSQKIHHSEVARGT